MEQRRFSRRTIIAAIAILIIAAVFTSSLTQSSAPNKSLQWRSFNEGSAEAKRTKKKILIDVYTNWCSWCKKMDASTYGDKNVAAYLNERYVVVKLNAESDRKLFYKDKEYTERELAGAFGITGYPSTLFLKSDGEPITIYPGFADAEQFKTVLSFIAEDHYLTKKFDEYVSTKSK